jgi:hypothetical protein
LKSLVVEGDGVLNIWLYMHLLDQYEKNKIQEKKNKIWTWGPFGPYLRGVWEHTKLWVSLGALLKSIPTSQTKELMVSCEC